MSKITAEQIQAVKDEFKQFDRNTDGELNKKEYYIMLDKDARNLNDRNIRLFFFALEPSASGTVKFNELIELMTESMNGDSGKLKEKLTQNLFKHYDKNNDKTLSFTEFKKLSRDFNLDDYDNQKARDLFAKIDSSNDKKISVEELLAGLSELFGI